VNLIFIPKYGIIGAAFATAIGFLFGAAYLFFISRDQIKIDYQTKNLSIIILSALIFLFAGLNLRNIFADFISIGGYLITLRLFVKLKVTKMFRLNS
jgi:O-antigen/teichoic acid export membrane protein